jgi:hypothetical protein
VRVPGKSCDIVGRVVVAEIVQQKKRIEILGLAETEGALEFGLLRLRWSAWVE